MRSLLAEPERRRIETAIAAAEARSSVEIVLVVSPRSGRYASSLASPVLLMTVLLACLAHLLWPELPAIWILAGQIPGAAVLWALANIPAVARLLIPNEDEIAAVRKEAFRHFAERAVFETNARSGVLLYLSELEHRIEILADRGLQTVFDAAAWSAHVTAIVEGIHTNRTAEAICQVVEQVSARCEAILGRNSASANELPDGV